MVPRWEVQARRKSATKAATGPASAAVKSPVLRPRRQPRTSRTVGTLRANASVARPSAAGGVETGEHGGKGQREPKRPERREARLCDGERERRGADGQENRERDGRGAAPAGIGGGMEDEFRGAAGEKAGGGGERERSTGERRRHQQAERDRLEREGPGAVLLGQEDGHGPGPERGSDPRGKGSDGEG